MSAYQILTSDTDGRHRVWGEAEGRIVATFEPHELAEAQADVKKRARKKVKDAPAVLELTAQRAGTARRSGVESPNIVQHSDGYRVWWPEKRIFVGRPGGGAYDTLVGAQGRLRELLEQQAGVARPAQEQLGMFASAPQSAGPLFKSNPMGDHLGVAMLPAHRRRTAASDEAAEREAYELGSFFPGDYQPYPFPAPHAPTAPGRRSAKRNGPPERDRAARETFARFIAPRAR